MEVLPEEATAVAEQNSEYIKTAHPMDVRSFA